MKTWLKGLKLAGWLAIAVALFVLGGECNGFRRQAKKEAAVTVAAPTRLEEKSPTVTLPCEPIRVLRPAERVREAIAERYNRADLKAEAPKAEILGERKLPELPNGGTALLTLEPGGRVELTVAPKPERLFEWSSVYEFGGLYGKGFGGDTRGRAWAAVEPIRFGRLHLRAEAGVDLRGGVSDGYGMVGVVWRSR